jgi:hypothetical protein
MKLVQPRIAPIAIVEVDRSHTNGMVEDDVISASRFTLFVRGGKRFQIESEVDFYPFWCITCHHPQEHCYCECKTCGRHPMDCSCPAIEACRSGCGRQLVKAYDWSQGFCAGKVYFAMLECGHTNVDDCSYLED